MVNLCREGPGKKFGLPVSLTVGCLAAVGDNGVDSVRREGLLAEKADGVVGHGNGVESVDS